MGHPPADPPPPCGHELDSCIYIHTYFEQYILHGAGLGRSAVRYGIPPTHEPVIAVSRCRMTTWP